MPQAVRVGIFMTLCLVVVAWLIMRIEDIHLWGEKGQRYDAIFDSVAGLDDKAAVRIAGVRIGRVDGIRLESRRARVSLLLDSGIVLGEGTRAAIANMGLLGDKYVELDPGPDGAPPLAPGATLPGDTPFSFDQAMAKLNEVGDSIKSVTSSLTGGPGGSGGAGIGDLVASLKQTADEIRALVAANRESVTGTVRNFEKFSATLATDLPRLSAQIERVLAQVEAVVADNRGNLKDSMANIKDLTTRVQTSVDNLNDITGKISRGEGTIGKLVNSDQAHNELVSALGSVEKGVNSLTDTLGRVQKLKLDLGMEGIYLEGLEDSRTAFRVDVKPQGEESPRLYRVELVSDPRGRLYDKTETVTVTHPDGTSETTTSQRVTRDRRRNGVSALFGLPFAERRGTLWAGMIESTGGVRADYGVIDRKLLLSFEAFDFSRENNLDPHLRLTTTWRFHPNLYLMGGYDDFLAKEYKSFFVGGGITWTDDDLKYLLGSVPKF